MKRNLFSILLFSFLAFSLANCTESEEIIDTPEPTQNLVEIALANGYTALAEALTITNLVDDLQSSNEFTVFAPTDQAFANLLSAIGQTDMNNVPVTVLEQILLYHVVPGKVFSEDLSTGNVSTLGGSDLSVNTASGIQINGISVTTPFDVEATNGVIHTINEVLVPEEIGQFVGTILAPAYFNNTFSTLVSAVVKAGLTGTLLEAENITIFAPTNEAFSAAGIDPEAVDNETLASVLTYHVVGAKVMSDGIPSEASTLNGNMIYFSLVESGNFINGNISIQTVDIESGSGVIHVIDNVLVPPSGNIVETAIGLSAGGEFTSLIAALSRTANEGTPEQNLIEVLSGDGPFTVFAPTNAAFQAVLDSNPDWNSLNDIPLETLIAVLSYHVVPARAFDKDIAGAIDENGQIGTALGENLTFDLNSFKINENINITTVNVNCTNGVIHVIDNVLLP